MKTRKFTLPFILLLCGYFSAGAQAHIGDSLGHMLVQQSPINPWHSGKSDSCFELISFPDDYAANPTKKYPVLFFFHGAGEAGPADGSQLSRQLANALPQFMSQGLKPSALAEDGNLYKFIVVCPQRTGGSTDINQLYYILPDILKKVRADTTRLYITGLSYGGYGTWSCLTDNGTSPFQGFIRHFAAILPQSQVALDQSVNTGSATGYNRVAHVHDAAADSLPVLIVCGDADDKWLYAKAYRDSINAHSPYIPAILIDRVGQAHTAASWDSIYSTTFRPSEIGGKNGYEWLIQYTNKRGYLTGHGAPPPPPPPPPPGPPSVNAGSDQGITLPTSSATLTGSGTETNGTIVSYTWTQVSGPSTAGFSAAGQASTSVTGLVQGVYSFQVLVKDNSGVTATDVVKVTVSAAVPPPPGPPSVNAGSDQGITLPTSSATLTGSGTETNGTIVSYTWTQVSGPSTAGFSAAGQASTSVTGLVQGVYSFQVLVKDNSGVTATDVVKVTVSAAVPPPPTPGPPSANAGSDQGITLPASSVTLTGSGTETNGTIMSYAWTQVSGPSTAGFSAAGQASTSVTGLVQGVYIFQLTVKDNSNVTATDVVKVTVNAAVPVPGLPVVDAGTNQVITLPVSNASLLATASETNGTIMSYAWTQLSGPSTAGFSAAGQASTSVTGLVQGVYSFQVLVKDNSGVTASDVVKVTVNAAPPPPPPTPGAPSANAGTDQGITLPTSSVTLTGSGTETNGTIMSYTWTQLSGPSTAVFGDAAQAVTMVSGLVQGVYTFQLTVKDNSGVTATDVVKVTVDAAPVTPPPPPPPPAANQLPVANAGGDQTMASSSTSVALDGSASYDPDGSIVKYQWMQLSGLGGVTITNAGAAKPVAYGLNPGSYVFRLTVTDDMGATGNDDVTVTVNAAVTPGGPTVPGAPTVPGVPTANAGLPTDTVKLPANTANLDGSSSSAANGATLVSYQWEQLSGPSAAALNTPTAASAVASKLVAGTYVFKLTVKDNNGVTATTTVTVVVLNDIRRTASAHTVAAQLYPNPARDLTTVKYQSDVPEKVALNVYTMSGVHVLSASYEKDAGETSWPLNISGLGRGVYTLRITGSGGGKETRMFVKQ